MPINLLVRVEGTPLAQAEPLDPFIMVRTIATARILMPASKVRLSAGRRSLSRECAALCFLAGANSIFVGEKLLTTPNPDPDEDQQLFRDLGIRPCAVLRNPSTLERLSAELRELRERSQFRSLSLPLGIDFNSNDYLGLSEDSRLREAVAEGLAAGARLGSGGSRLLSGNARAWEELEEEFAGFTGAEAGLFFTSGYAANIGLLSSVIRKEDLVFSDRANHASLIDGIRYSGARKVIFPHRDWDFLESELRRFAGFPQEKFIVVESLFSMDGTGARLEIWWAWRTVTARNWWWMRGMRWAYGALKGAAWWRKPGQRGGSWPPFTLVARPWPAPELWCVVLRC